MALDVDTLRRRLDRQSRQEFLESAYRRAYEYGVSKGNCSQCTVAALEDVLGLPEDGVLKAAFLLAGGLGTSTKSACGALAGGVMMLSLLFGRSRQQFDSDVHTSQGADLARELMHRFEHEYGGYTCAAVQESVFGRTYDLPDPDSFAEFAAINKDLRKCPEVEGKGCRWTAEIIWDALHR